MKRSVMKVDSSALLGAEGRIPRKVATCPECGRTLHYEVTACFEGKDHDEISEITLDCRAPIKNKWGDYTHRYWQSDWQDIVDRCKAWVRKHRTPNNKGQAQRPAGGNNG